MAVDLSYSFVHSCCLRLHSLQVVIYDGHGGHLLSIQALKQGVPLIQQELYQSTDICLNLLFESLFLQLGDREVQRIRMKDLMMRSASGVYVQC